ncbi:hypothetical protein BJV74DRAFT_798207 [Russula compacta]|nr:hypothetical protein BJV74DRAFT_798207 [Russula compacta]
MSQSLRAIKQFRIRELIVASPKSRIPPAASTAASDLPQRPPAAEPSRSSGGGSGNSGTPLNLNPFLPHKNPESGRWAPPRYSLRRQAELVKHARASGTLHLLPPGPKMTAAQQQQQQQQSLLAAAAAAAAAATATPPTSFVMRKAGKFAEGVEGVLEVRSRQGQETREQGQEQGQEVAAEGEGGSAAGLDSRGAAAAAAWMRSVEWVGTVRERNVAGADVGNRLYAGKKRMFKGHKWERVRERRVARTKVLVRDMDQRVQRFKGYRAKGKPLPLARRSNVLKKTQKLPF